VRSFGPQHGIRADTCGACGRAGKQAAEAGVTIIDKFDRKPFEDATRPLREEMRADPRFGPLIERIQAVQ
jgi:TRAP-type C4-dicarboxylate transport system substrate-binding protein